MIRSPSEVAPLTGLATVAATEAYKAECCDLFRELLGASRVIAWNAVVRDAGEGEQDVKGTQQLKVESEFASASALKAVAGFAHVDQDEVSLSRARGGRRSKGERPLGADPRRGRVTGLCPDDHQAGGRCGVFLVLFGPVLESGQ